MADIWTYHALHGGKFHARRDPVTSVARCRGSLELDTSAEAPVITVRPGEDRHPIICKRCVYLVQRDRADERVTTKGGTA